MWMKLGIAALVLGACAVAYVATRPDSFSVERSAEIGAPPEVVFALINDFRRWVVWSPYERLGEVERTFRGPEAGVGATYAWRGEKSGEGTMTIEESTPQRILIRLEFIKPMTATNHASFELVPTATGTRVRWRMEGKNTLIGKVMSPFMDAFVGQKHEEGLANLDLAAREEAQRVARSPGTAGPSEPVALP